MGHGSDARNLSFSAHNGLPADLYSGTGGGSPKAGQRRECQAVFVGHVSHVLKTDSGIDEGWQGTFLFATSSCGNLRNS